MKDGKIIECGKLEFIINVLNLFAIAVIYTIGVLFSEKVMYTLYIIEFILFYSILIIVRNSGIIHLDLSFLIFLFIYSFSVPVSNVFLGNDINQNIIKDASNISILAYFSYCVGILLQSGKHRHIGSLKMISSKDAKFIRKSGQWVFLFGFITSLSAILFTVGFSQYFSAGYAGRSLIKREAGPIEIGLYISLVGFFSIFLANLLSEYKERASKIFVIVFFILFSVYASFLGIRRPLFLLGLGLFAGYSIVYHRPKLKTALPIMLLAFVFLTTFAQYRQLISTVGVLETVAFIQNNASWEWLDISRSELGAPFRTLTDYLGYNQQWREYLLGSSYVQTPLYVLPSFLTGGLQSLSVQYTHTFFSQDFISIGGNMGLSPVTEAFLNFGALGVFFIFAIFGFSLGKANRWFHSVGRGKTVYIILFMILVPWTAFFMRLDMASFAKGFLYSQLIPFLLFCLLFILYKSQSRVRH